tara:strand:- start:436 stop:666 length:231 start_codon:yes stop_codon:yes gene_type:complete
MDNYITVELNGGSRYLENVALTEGEVLALNCKGNGAFTNKIWDIICERIEKREGMKIKGFFNLISITCNGKTKPLH